MYSKNPKDQCIVAPVPKALGWIRWICTAALLGVVWLNAHWSVATLLTLLSFGREVDLYLLDLRWKDTMRKSEQFHV